MALPMTSTGYSPQQQQLFQPFQIGSKGIRPVKKRSGIGKFFLGEQEQFQRMPTQTPEGMNALQQLLSGGLQGLQNTQAGFEPIANEAKRQFQSETIPGLAERFTAMGGSDTAGSSDLLGTLGGAGAGLQSQLASMGAQYGLQNREGLLRQLQLGLQPQYDTQFRPSQSGALQNLFSMLSPGLSSFGQQVGQEAGSGMAKGGMAGLVAKLLPFLL